MIANNPHLSPPPTSFALACRMAERAHARAMGFKKPRPRIDWQGVTYYRCLGCKRWKASEMFYLATGGGRGSRCRVCDNAAREGRRLAAKVAKVAKVRPVAAKPKPVPVPSPPKPVMSCMSRLQPLAFEGNHVPDAARVEPASRWGNEDPERDASDFEKNRFAKARQYNPALTWDEWLVLTRPKPRGRRPKQSPAPEGARAAQTSPLTRSEV